MAFPVVAMIDQLCDLLCLVMSYDAESCQEVRDCSLWLLLVQFFEKEGCKMVDMSCEEHDRQAASTQFITHTVGRVLGAMELQATPIDTRQAPLLRLVFSIISQSVLFLSSTLSHFIHVVLTFVGVLTVIIVTHVHCCYCHKATDITQLLQHPQCAASTVSKVHPIVAMQETTAAMSLHDALSCFIFV